MHCGTSSQSHACILLVAPPDSYRVAPYIRAANQLGIPIKIASHGEHSLVNEVASGLHIDLYNQDAAIKAIVAASEQDNYCGIIAADDMATEIAAHAAHALRLPHNPPQAVHLTRWKHKARAVLKKAGLPAPDFWTVNISDATQGHTPAITFPCVVKPLNLSASRGVIRCNNIAELVNASKRIANIIAPLPDAEARSTVLIEQYIPGAEIAVEAILVDGELTPIAIFDKPDPLEGPYFEESYYVTPSRLPAVVQQKAVHIIEQACKAYGLTTGPVHAELRINDDEPYIIEIAARTIGGECARLLEYASGQSLEALVIQFATGLVKSDVKFDTAAGVLMIPTPQSGILRRVEGVLSAQKLPHINAIHLAIREGHELITLPEGASYLGFIFASADSPQQVEQALRDAYAQLNIIVDPLWRIEGIPGRPRLGAI